LNPGEVQWRRGMGAQIYLFWTPELTAVIARYVAGLVTIRDTSQVLCTHLKSPRGASRRKREHGGDARRTGVSATDAHRACRQALMTKDT
jgi:hypothetical protein